jgi:hypothetical protein
VGRQGSEIGSCPALYVVIPIVRVRGESRHFFGVFSDLGEILGRKAKKRRSVVCGVIGVN